MQCLYPLYGSGSCPLSWLRVEAHVVDLPSAPTLPPPSHQIIPNRTYALEQVLLSLV